MRQSTRTASRSSRRGGNVDFVEVLPQPKRWLFVSFLGALIRWRAELAVLAVGITAWVWLQSFGNPVLTNCVLWGFPVLIVALPWTRRFVVARVWCVMDRHRVRSCLKQTKIRTMNRDGQYPFLLWARPIKTGERLWMWLPAGTAAEDIDSAVDYLAPACFARSARLHRPKKITTFVALDIVRRDPLGTKDPVRSPLSGWLGGKHNSTDNTSDVTPITASPVVDSTSTVEETDSAATTTTPARTRVATASSVIVNGEDLSDYVD